METVYTRRIGIPKTNQNRDNSDKQGINLPHLEISPTETFNSFSIIPQVYETELDKKYGIKLGDLKNGEKSKFLGNLEKNISFKGGYSHSSDKIEEKILKKYKSVPGFCSMIIKNKKELLKHVKNIHELSYNHYVWAKENNLKGSFPDYCCGSSSRNVFLSLMEKGYPNATHFCNPTKDHAYPGLPFLFGENQEKGFIIIDPTSDQLFEDKDTAPRNYLFVISGDKWKYKTDWDWGSNLFPSSNDRSKFSNLSTLRGILSASIHQSKDINNYFIEVFENPIEVNIESF